MYQSCCGPREDACLCDTSDTEDSNAGFGDSLYASDLQSGDECTCNTAANACCTPVNNYVSNDQFYDRRSMQQPQQPQQPPSSMQPPQRSPSNSQRVGASQSMNNGMPRGSISQCAKKCPSRTSSKETPSATNYAAPRKLSTAPNGPRPSAQTRPSQQNDPGAIQRGGSCTCPPLSNASLATQPQSQRGVSQSQRMSTAAPTSDTQQLLCPPSDGNQSRMSTAANNFQGFESPGSPCCLPMQRDSKMIQPQRKMSQSSQMRSLRSQSGSANQNCQTQMSTQMSTQMAPPRPSGAMPQGSFQPQPQNQPQRRSSMTHSITTSQTQQCPNKICNSTYPPGSQIPPDYVTSGLSQQMSCGQQQNMSGSQIRSSQQYDIRPLSTERLAAGNDPPAETIQIINTCCLPARRAGSQTRRSQSQINNVNMTSQTQQSFSVPQQIPICCGGSQQQQAQSQQNDIRGCFCPDNPGPPVDNQQSDLCSSCAEFEQPSDDDAANRCCNDEGKEPSVEEMPPDDCIPTKVPSQGSNIGTADIGKADGKRGGFWQHLQFQIFQQEGGDNENNAGNGNTANANGNGANGANGNCQNGQNVNEGGNDDACQCPCDQNVNGNAANVNGNAVNGNGNLNGNVEHGSSGRKMWQQLTLDIFQSKDDSFDNADQVGSNSGGWQQQLRLQIYQEKSDDNDNSLQSIDNNANNNVACNDKANYENQNEVVPVCGDAAPPTNSCCTLLL